MSALTVLLVDKGNTSALGLIWFQRSTFLIRCIIVPATDKSVITAFAINYGTTESSVRRAFGSRQQIIPSATIGGGANGLLQVTFGVLSGALTVGPNTPLVVLALCFAGEILASISLVRACRGRGIPNAT